MKSDSRLDSLRIASPCQASWIAMKGDNRVRFCGSCEKNVYNLSAMTSDEANELLRVTEGKVCVQFYRRRDGTVLTSDCPVGARSASARRLRRLSRIAAALMAAWGLESLLQARGAWPESVPLEPAEAIHHLKEWVASKLAFGQVRGAPPTCITAGTPVFSSPAPVMGGAAIGGSALPPGMLRGEPTRPFPAPGSDLNDPDESGLKGPL